MQPRQPIPPDPFNPFETTEPAETVEVVSPCIPPAEKRTNYAAAIKEVEARLAEAKARIKSATEPRAAPAAAKEPEAPPAKVEVRTESSTEPHVAPAAAREPEAPPAEAEVRTESSTEPHVAPAAAKEPKAPPAEAEASPPGAIDAQLADATARLAEAETRAAEQRDALLRAKAETENVRRRMQEEITKASKFAAEKFAAAMLPVKDSLEAALTTRSQTLTDLYEGVELTLKQLTAAFESANLTEENPIKQKFDPNKHQAISALESEAEPNTVLDVLQKGYLLHERVIRPAMVIVSKAKIEA